MRYIKLDVDFDKSLWVYTLSIGSQLAWVKLLCHVKKCGIMGSAKRLSTFVLSRDWQIGEEDIAKMLKAAEQNEALLFSADGDSFSLTGWTNYQTDSSTERVRRYRERQTALQEESVTPCNVTSSLQRSGNGNSINNSINNTKDVIYTEAGKANRTKSEVHQVEVKTIIDELNRLAGTRFAYSGSQADFVRARLRDGNSVEECLAVVRKKVADFSKEADMKRYRRPSTLFNKTKFEAYLSEVEAEKAEKEQTEATDFRRRSSDDQH